MIMGNEYSTMRYRYQSVITVEWMFNYIASCTVRICKCSFLSQRCDPSSFALVCRLALYPVKIITHYNQLSLLLYPQNIQRTIAAYTLNHCEHLQTLSGLGLMTTDQPPAYIPHSLQLLRNSMLASSKYGIASSYDIITNLWHCIILFFLTVDIILLVSP